MMCHAILKDSFGGPIYNRCKVSRLDNLLYSTPHQNPLFCRHHQDISMEEHKQMWFDLFILGVNGHNPFLYKVYERNKQRILRDLEMGAIVLTQEDIDKIPAKSKYIDIYLLLMEHGYIDIQENKNPDLYWKCLKYLSEFLLLQSPTTLIKFSPAAEKIRDVLVLQNTENLYFFLCIVAGLDIFPAFKGEGFPKRVDALAVFLKDLLSSPVGKDLLWSSFTPLLVEHYKGLPKEAGDNRLVEYLSEKFIPLCREFIKVEKQKQKDRIDVFKEELMMVCWHPDRFVEYCLDEEEKAEIKALP